MGTGAVIPLPFFFLVGYVEESYGGLYKAPTKEERRKQAAKRIERQDKVY